MNELPVMHAGPFQIILPLKFQEVCQCHNFLLRKNVRLRALSSLCHSRRCVHSEP